MAISAKEERYTRLQQIDWWDQRKLQNATILVAGAGALGNEILKNLALLGTGTIVVVDFDKVELSNLTRSVLFREGDVGKYKVDVAARGVQEINPDVQVIPIRGDLKWNVGLGVVQRADAVLSSVDSLGARVDLNRMCWRIGTPFIDGGLGELSGTMRVFVPPKGACYECGLSKNDYRQLSRRYSCQMLAREAPSNSIPTTPTTASIIASLQVQEAMKFVHGLPTLESQGVTYDGWTHEFFKTKYQRRDSCMAHGFSEEVIALPEITQTQNVSDVIKRLESRFGQGVRLELDREIVLRMSCPWDNCQEKLIRPQSSLTTNETLCPECGRPRTLHMTHTLGQDSPEEVLEASLEKIGVPPLHILYAVEPNGNRYQIEISGDSKFIPARR